MDNNEFSNLNGLIYFTDGYGIFPAKCPPYKTAVVYVGGAENNPDIPVWAVKLILEPEDFK